MLIIVKIQKWIVDESYGLQKNRTRFKKKHIRPITDRQPEFHPFQIPAVLPPPRHANL